MTINLTTAIAALEALRGRVAIYNRHTDYGIRLAIQTLKNLAPGAERYQREERKARWIMSNDGVPFCPICRHDAHEKTPFCAWCGTRMVMRDSDF